MACDDRPVCIFAFYLQIRGGGIFILLFLIRTMHVADISWHKIGKLRRFMFDLILFFLVFPDQKVFVIIVPYRSRGLFGILGRYNDLRELGVCKVCRRHAR